MLTFECTVLSFFQSASPDAQDNLPCLRTDAIVCRTDTLDHLSHVQWYLQNAASNYKDDDSEISPKPQRRTQHLRLI